MSANSESTTTASSTSKTSVVPKKITNAQTVCNERSEKGKLCNGHLKQLNTGGEDSRVHLRGDDVLSKCNICGTLYMGPPLGHLRDPGKMNRFVARELTALLQAAGGTLPAFVKNEAGAMVQVNPAPGHGQAAPAAKAVASAQPAAAAPAEETVEQKRARKLAESAAKKASAAPIPGAAGPVAGETPEQKMARLKAVVAEAKRRKEAGADAVGTEIPASTPASAANVEAVTTHTAAAVSTTASPSSPVKSAPSGPVPGETPEQKVARLKAVVEEAKRRKEAGESTPVNTPRVTASSASEVVAAKPATNGSVQTAAPLKAAAAAPAGPVPGETKEQKLARLQAVVAEAKRRKESGETGAAVSVAATAELPSNGGAPASLPVESVSVPPVAEPAPPVAEVKASAPSGPIPGETREEKIARLQAVVAAAKQKAGK